MRAVVSSARYVGSRPFAAIPGKFALVVCFDREFDARDILFSDEHEGSAWIDLDQPRPLTLPLCYWTFCLFGDA
ncbi:hypothetical protein Bsp3421_001794 [Burkholderia sp. FERM BP-3421]|jgi:8-oxo-dGTP diphosphatase|uniref:hypothetical protein n=1 Tax=Burkholderia sp. FERM BP-3421 TaxID=1494466 RepID=UPI00236042DD|nr:hypothetical protein [Burkholderia sp. FERM BP-3421]WDD91841.1 hypothetical protein Bsp3421_001794 [Burkholderia sp. FERM BP-3421]